MPPLTLEGDTLGKKHESYNKLVKDTIANNSYELSKINSDDNDLDNLLKIDIASKTRNVHFIIETLKCDDMLYVSRAIKTSRWLITDTQYAHIINPEYLHTQLFPSMITKAVNKLMLHIRLHLRQHERVEAFYNYLKDTKDSYKWLEHCSVPFIRSVLESRRSIPLSLFKRLCERDISFLSFHKNVDSRDQFFIQREMLPFLNAHTEAVLNYFESDPNGEFPSLKKKYTKIVMKKDPQKILDNFDKYTGADMSVVAKYMRSNDIVHFLKTQMQKSNLRCYLNNFDVLKHFVKNMPKDERFQFVKKNFIEKTDNALCSDCFSCNTPYYHWYNFAPFNEAFPDMKKLLRLESSPTERSLMLSVLITSARRSPQDIKTLLKFYYEKHINEPFKFKIKFTNNLLTQVRAHDFDTETWNLLDQIFHSMEVYTESENNVQLCLQSIILYKVLHDEKVPDIVEKKILFDTFIKFQHKLENVQQEKFFAYLISYIYSKIQKQRLAKKAEFDDTIRLLLNALALLKDWKRDIKEFPFIIDKVKELLEIKKENSWDSNLSCFYRTNKHWRKHMFNLSLSLNQNEDVCLNALKHNAQLLIQHHDELEPLRTNNALPLRRFLSKLRVYFPQSLAQHWIDTYSRNVDITTGQKAVIRGLFMLLPHKQVIDMATKHAPNNNKINWGETDQAEISLRKHIAGQLHMARPLIPLDTVLLYTKGDYLQFAVPSLSAVLHCLSQEQSRIHLPKLLDAPVSLQKYGLYVAFEKLKTEELQHILSNIWNTTKNPTIRAVLFSHTYNSLCNVKNPTIEEELWQLLNIFISNLSAEESKEIYEKMGKMANIPPSVQNRFFMKSYEFLTSLPEKANCKNHVNNLRRHVNKIIHLLDEDFVANKLLSPVETTFKNESLCCVELCAAFVLCGKTEEEQLGRYRRILVPAMEYAFQEWHYVREGEYFIRGQLSKLLTFLIWYFRKLVTLYKIPSPVKLFVEIKNKMAEHLSFSENYSLFTRLKLATEYVNLVESYKGSYFREFEKDFFSESDIGYMWMTDEIENVWTELNEKISPIFAHKIVNILKEDTERFRTVCWLFNEALSKMFSDLSFPRDMFKMETLKHMLTDDQSCIASYIVVCHMIPKYLEESIRASRAKLREMISSHPSDEVKMHYYDVFSNMAENT